MGSLTRFEKSDDQTMDGLTITWNANEPSGSSQLTILDGVSLTPLEFAKAVEKINTQLDKAKADIASLYLTVNAGE